MNFQKFTIKSQEAIQNAQEIAASYSNQSIELEHLLAGEFVEGDTIEVGLDKQGVD